MFKKTFLSLSCAAALAAGVAPAFAASSFFLVVPVPRSSEPPPPVITASDPTINPLALQFAPVQVGDSAPAQNFSITNTGPLPLDLAGFRLLGNSPYSLMAPCTTLQPEQSCDAYVYLDTVNAGTFPDTLMVDHAGPSGASTLSLSADVRAPAGTLPAGVDFGYVSVGSAKDMQVQLKNTGVGRLTISPLGASAVSGSGFGFVESTCPSSLPVDGACNITVRMTGTLPAEQQGRLSVVTGAGTLQAALRGVGQQSDLVFSSGPVAPFNKVNVGESATSAAVTLTNSGNVAAQDIVLATASDAYQIVDNTCTTSLSAGANCTFKVKFAPQSAGTKLGELAASSHGETLATSPLTGVAGAAAFKGSVASRVFATRYRSGTGVHNPFDDLSLTITNTGSSAAEKLSTSINYDQANSGLSFSFQNNSCVNRLSAGASCSTLVRVMGSKVGSWSGKVRISSHSGELLIPFTFNTIEPDVDITQTAPMQDAKVGEAFVATYTVQLKPTGALVVSVPKITGNTSEYSLASGTTCNGVAIAANKSCVIKVLFTPAEAGQRPEATLTTTIGGIERSVMLNAKGL